MLKPFNEEVLEGREMFLCDTNQEVIEACKDLFVEEVVLKNYENVTNIQFANTEYEDQTLMHCKFNYTKQLIISAEKEEGMIMKYTTK